MTSIAHKNFVKRAFVAFFMALVVVMGGIVVAPRTAVAADVEGVLLTDNEPWGSTLADALLGKAVQSRSGDSLPIKELATYPLGGHGGNHYGRPSNTSEPKDTNGDTAGKTAATKIFELGNFNVLDTSNLYGYDDTKNDNGLTGPALANEVYVNVGGLARGLENVGKSVIKAVSNIGRVLNPYYLFGWGNTGDKGNGFTNWIADYLARNVGLDRDFIVNLMRLAFVIVLGVFGVTVIIAIRNVKNAKRNVAKSRNMGLRALVILLAIPIALVVTQLVDDAVWNVNNITDGLRVSQPEKTYIDVLEYAGNTNFDMSLFEQYLKNPTDENIQKFNKQLAELSKKAGVEGGAVNPSSMEDGFSKNAISSVNDYVSWVKNAQGKDIAASYWNGIGPNLDGTVDATVTTGFTQRRSYVISGSSASSSTNTTSDNRTDAWASGESGAASEKEENFDKTLVLSDALFLNQRADQITTSDEKSITRKTDNGQNDTVKTLELTGFGGESNKQMVVLDNSADPFNTVPVNLYDVGTYCYTATAPSMSYQQLSPYSFTMSPGGDKNAINHQLVNPVTGKALENYSGETTSSSGDQVDMVSKPVNDLWYANAAKIAAINSRAGIKNDSFSTQSMVFLLQMKYNHPNNPINSVLQAIEGDYGWTFGGVNLTTLGANHNSATEAGQMVGNRFSRYVMPVNNAQLATSYAAKTSGNLFVYVSAGWAALLAAFGLITTPLVGNIIKVFRGFFRGLVTGDLFGLLEFGVYYVAIGLSFIMADLAIIAGQVLISLFGGLMVPLQATTDIVASVNSVVDPSNWAAGTINAATGFLTGGNGTHMMGISNSIFTIVLFFAIGAISVVVLTWPIMTIRVGGKSGKERTCGIVVYMMNVPTMLAEAVVARFPEYRSKLYGTRRSGVGNGAFGKHMKFKDSVKHRGKSIAKGAAAAGAVATGVGALGAAAGAGASVAGGLMGAGAGAPTALAEGAKMFGRTGMNAIGSAHNVLSDLRKKNPQMKLSENGGIVGLIENFDKGGNALRNNFAKSLEQQMSGASYNAAALNVNDPTGAGINEVGVNGKSVDAKVKPNNHETNVGAREDDIAGITDSGEETDSPMNGARDSAGVVSGEGSAAEVASDVAGQTTGYELNEQAVALNENGERVAVEVADRLADELHATQTDSGLWVPNGDKSLDIKGANATVNAPNSTFIGGDNPLTRLSNAAVDGGESTGTAERTGRATTTPVVEGEASKAASNLQYERRDSYMQAFRDYGVQRPSTSEIRVRQDELESAYREAGKAAAPTDGSALERLASSTRTERTERTERVERLKETVREIHEHNNDPERLAHNREVIDAYKADAMAGLRSRYQVDDSANGRGRGRDDSSNGEVTLSQEGAQRLAEAISEQQEESREQRIDEQRRAFEQAMRNQNREK